MQFQFISAEGYGKQRSYLIPPYVTRFYYRKKFYCAGNKVEFILEYPFLMDIYLDGDLVSTVCSKNGVYTFAALLDEGEHLLAMRAYLSDDSAKIYPELHAEIWAQGELIAETDETWEGFTFPAFYTVAEEEDWMKKSEQRCYARCFRYRPSEINRSYYFKKDIFLEEEPAHVTLYATAKGLYRCFCNGNEIGENAVLLPGVVKAKSDGFPYESAKVNYYQEFDVTAYLKKGANIFTMLSGNGWYASEGFNILRIQRNEVAARLVFRMKNGSSKEVVTDQTWKCKPSPILENDLQFGERWNGSLNLMGKDASEKWQRCKVCKSERAKKQTFPNIHIIEEIAPAHIAQKAGSFLCDFGVNMAGRGKIVLRGARKGDRIVLRYGEKRLPDGTLSGGPYHDVFYAKDTWDGGKAPYGAKSFDCYIAEGKEEETFSPRFCFTGFRYIEVFGIKSEHADVFACKMHTKDSVALCIDTDSAILKKLSAAAMQSFFSNWFAGPIDCPTREKNYWNGDAAILARVAMYFADCAETLSQWTTNGRKIRSDAVAWRDEDYIVPYEIYKFTGKKKILRANYKKMRATICERLAESEKGIWYNDKLTYFGDHAPPLHCSNIDPKLFSECFFYLGTKCLAEIADILGEKSDQKLFETASDEIKKAFHKNFLPQVMSAPQDANLGCFVLPLAFNILRAPDASAVCNLLENRLVARNYIINCGAVVAAWLPSVLCRFGKYDTAFRVLTCTQYPSWGYMLETGATTTTEYWEGMNSSDEGDSLNHAFKGAAVRCLIENFAGLHDFKPGFREILIRPCFPNGLNSVKMRYDTPKGTLELFWKRENRQIKFDLITPVKATVCFLSKEYKIKAGYYSFEEKCL